MTEISNPQCSSVYAEDVSIAPGGQSLVGSPCVLWKLLVTLDTSGDAIISFSDDSTSYSSTNRKMKVVVSGPATVPVTFPKGMFLSRGLCVQSNIASVDVTVVYD